MKLDELERLSKAATPGPWVQEIQPRKNSEWVCFDYKSPIGFIFDTYAGEVTAHRNDAELIAAMRNSIDALIAVARAGQTALKYVEPDDDYQLLKSALAELERTSG